MESNVAYRTLLIRRRVEEIPQDQLQRFMEVQKAFRKWATEWYKSHFEMPMPKENPLKYFAVELKYALALIPSNGLKNDEWRVPLLFNAQLRIGNEKDMSRGVFVDLPFREVRIRKWSGVRGNVIVLKLRESNARWILERVREGGRLVMALAWVGRTRQLNIVTFNMALVFAREAKPIVPRRVLAIDLNALHNGVVWGIVEEGRIVRRSVERPDLDKIKRLQKEISRLDSLCAEKGGLYCRQASTAKSRLWRLLRWFEDEVSRKIVKIAIQYKAVVIIDAPEDKSMRKIKESGYAPERKLYLDIGRLRRRIEQLAKWYGVPFREQRLYSTICPRCGAKMEELPNRRVRCPSCGFEAMRDEVPLLWAAKLFRQLLQTSSFSNIPAPIVINLNP